MEGRGIGQIEAVLLTARQAVRYHGVRPQQPPPGVLPETPLMAMVRVIRGGEAVAGEQVWRGGVSGWSGLGLHPPQPLPMDRTLKGVAYVSVWVLLWGTAASIADAVLLERGAYATGTAGQAVTFASYGLAAVVLAVRLAGRFLKPEA